MNGDGHPDLVAANTGDNSLSIFYNPGNGIFDDAENIPLDNSPRSFFPGDLDADGDVDLAAACWHAGQCEVLLNQGKGQFQTAGRYPTGKMSSCVASGDLNGDGLDDLVVTNADGKTVTVLENTSSR